MASSSTLSNDYELMHLHVATDLADRMRERGILVPGVDRAWQLGCADKLRMAQLLEGIGMPTPRTVTGDDEAGIAEIPAASERLVVKHRLGSGSSGLALVPADGVRAAIDAAIAAARRPVLVTGGGSGIGAALVEGFAGQGARVAFLDVLDAQRALIDARTRYLQSLQAVVDAWARIERLYGPTTTFE